MSKLKVGAVVKFSGKKLIVASINNDGTATLNYAAGSGKTGFYGKVRLSTGKTPDMWNPQVVDKSLGKDEVTTLDLYFVPDELDGSENDDMVVSYIRKGNPLSDKQKEEFLNSKNSMIRRMMGMREDLTTEQYEALVNDKEEWARGLVAYNKNLTEEQIVKLSKDKGDDIREAIAWRQDVKTEVLDSLVRDKSVDVRIRLARNPNISDDSQYTLITDRSPRVRASLVENKNALPETLTVLSRDRDKFVKTAVAARNA
jgi:hypothetical protein